MNQAGGAQHAIPEGYRALEEAFLKGDAGAISLLYAEDAELLRSTAEGFRFLSVGRESLQ